MRLFLFTLLFAPTVLFAKINYQAPVWDCPQNGINYYKQADVPLADTIPADSSKKEKPPKKKKHILKRLRFGGYVGANFGTVSSVEVSPLVGYMVTNKLMVGLGFSVYYVWNTNSNIDGWMYGPRIFSRYNLVHGLFLHGEVEFINAPNTEFRNGEFIDTRTWYTSVILGGGIQRSRLSFTALYIVNYDENRTPYSSPWIFRFGVMI